MSVIRDHRSPPSASSIRFGGDRGRADDGDDFLSPPNHLLQDSGDDGDLFDRQIRFTAAKDRTESISKMNTDFFALPGEIY